MITDTTYQLEIQTDYELMCDNIRKELMDYLSNSGLKSLVLGIQEVLILLYAQF